MGKSKIEGTFYLDGLLEGPVFSAEDEAIINAFVRQAKKVGLKFHASINAGRFSLLADTDIVEVYPIGGSVDSRLVRILEDFLDNYSPEERLQLMSTLRSVEYIPGHEVQSVYAIKPDGKVELEQRTVKADTIRPAEPIDLRDKLKIIAVCVVVLCAGIGISAFFVPYNEIAGNVIRELKPFNQEDLNIELGSFEKYFLCESAQLNKSNDVIQLVCRISESYPATEQQLNELWKSSAESVSERLTLEALARNYIRCELFDSDGNFLGQRICYMQWIDDERQTFGIVIPFVSNLKQVKISY